jgi:hypothetical protein
MTPGKRVERWFRARQVRFRSAPPRPVPGKSRQEPAGSVRNRFIISSSDISPVPIMVYAHLGVFDLTRSIPVSAGSTDRHGCCSPPLACQYVTTFEIHPAECCKLQHPTICRQPSWYSGGTNREVRYAVSSRTNGTAPLTWNLPVIIGLTHYERASSLTQTQLCRTFRVRTNRLN